MTFPVCVYRRGTYTGQIDHVGWLSKVVRDEAQYLEALAEGWHLGMIDPAPEPPRWEYPRRRKAKT